MEEKELFMLIGLGINFAGMLCGAVFVVVSVKATTAVLVSQVKSLHYAINKLTSIQERLDNKLDNHAERLTILETLTKRTAVGMAHEIQKHPEAVSGGSHLISL